MIAVPIDELLLVASTAPLAFTSIIINVVTVRVITILVITIHAFLQFEKYLLPDP